MIGQRNSRRVTQTPPKIQYTEANTWHKGVFSRLDADRTPIDALRTTENALLDQDGIVQPRQGLTLYGVQPPGTALGQFFEFVKLNTGVTPAVPETWLITMRNISGVGTLCINKDGGAWTQIAGKTYSATARAHFEQIYGNILVTNGVDSLSYYVIATGTITTFSQLVQPSGAPTVTPATVSGFNGTNVPLYYAYTYANQGETAASSAGTATVNKPIGQWNGTTETVTVTASGIPTGTLRVNLYLGNDPNSLFFLDIISITAGQTSWTYTDTGKMPQNPQRTAPTGDSTTGPKTTRATNIKGQVYMVGDSDNPDQIWFGSSKVGHQLDFSFFNDGGFVSPNKGGKDFPVVVRPFRDGKGNPMAACFSKGTNGAGKRYLLNPSTVSAGGITLAYMSVLEDNGQDGTDSPDGVVMLNDGAWYPSRSGFKTSNTKANIQNIISTTGISDVIAPDVRALSAKYMDQCVGLAYDQRIYWALPYQSTVNNQLWVLDLRQAGAWVRPLYVAADWMTLYADNSDGLTKFLVSSNNMLYRFDDNAATTDNGTPFSVNIGSGNVHCGPQGESANIRYVTFVFLRPQGAINCSVTLNTEDGPVTYSGTFSSTTNQSVGAWGGIGWGVAGWGDLGVSPMGSTVAAAQARVKFTLEIDEECDYYTWNVGSTAPGVSFQLAEVIDSRVAVGYKDPIN